VWPSPSVFEFIFVEARVMQLKLLSGERSVIFSNKFCIRGEGTIYFDIRAEGDVIKASFRGGECNLHFRK
jgi:hypothetical protein